MAQPKPVSETPALPPNVDAPLKGRFVTLQVLTDDHIPDLWQGLGTDEPTWRWLPGGAPKSQEEFAADFKEIAEGKNIILTVLGDPDHLNPPASPTAQHLKPLGVMMYGPPALQHRITETGAILAPILRRTVASTEAHYLLLRNIFSPAEGPPYRRCAWTTNSFNTASRRCAQRLGYVQDGVWRNAQIDRGFSRDSVWLSMIEEDWGPVREALERWLADGNFDGEGRQRERLEAIRTALLGGKGE